MIKQVLAAYWHYLLIIFALMACMTRVSHQRNDDIGSQEPMGPFKVQLEANKPIVLKTSDPQCTLQQALDDMGKVNIYVRDNGKTVLKTLNFKGISGKGLRNRFAAGVYTNFYSVLTYDQCDVIGKHQYSCNKRDYEVVNKGNLLAFCKRQYPRQSLENAALSAMAGVLQAANFFSPLVANKKILPISLLILPLLETKLILSEKNTISSIQSNNAFWSNMAREGNYPTIALLPHTDNYGGIGYNLWESLGVSAHEWGHHLFFSLTSSMYGKRGKVWSFSDNVLAITRYYEAPSPQRMITQHTSLSALNETFADLTAYYAFQDQYESLGQLQIGRFTVSRNIASAQNDDGLFKALDLVTLKHFLSNKTSFPKGYLRPNNQDVHTIGADIGYGLDRLFGAKFEDSAYHHHVRQKAQLLVEWGQKIPLTLNLYEDTPLQTLEKAIFAAIEVAQKKPKIMTTWQCSIVKQVFPVFTLEWQNQYTCLDE